MDLEPSELKVVTASGRRDNVAPGGGGGGGARSCAI